LWLEASIEIALLPNTFVIPHNNFQGTISQWNTLHFYLLSLSVLCALVLFSSGEESIGCGKPTTFTAQVHSETANNDGKIGGVPADFSGSFFNVFSMTEGWNYLVHLRKNECI
jgi:hypothetical protein